MNYKIEVKGKDEKGRMVTKMQFYLCDECAWELLNSVDYNIVE